MSDYDVELRGAAAIAYVESFLRQTEVDPDLWLTRYVNDKTGEQWELDYPDAALHGGGPPRLRRRVLDPAGR